MIVNSLHNGGLYGFLSLFGENLILCDYQGHVKLPDMLFLLFGDKKIDELYLAPEILLNL